MNRPDEPNSAPMQCEVLPVILCGGWGTRLWPLSRTGFAKQHVALFEGDSLFQQTLARLTRPPFARPLIIAARDARFMVTEQAAASGVEVELALEPEGRDTLAAVTFAAVLASRRDPKAPVLVLPSDHFVPDAQAFASTVVRAAKLALDGELVIFAVRPTSPATAYGYIVPGAPVVGEARRVDRFVEKPEAEHALALIAEGALWNAGMFCFRPDVALAEIETYAPEALAKVRAAVAAAEIELGALVAGDEFRQTVKTSFDYAVMERTTRAVVLPVDYVWSDLGDWEATWQLSPKDETGVASSGQVVAMDVTNSYIRSEGRLVCALGVDNLAIIETPDAVLVTNLERAQDVKMVVAELESIGRDEARLPQRVQRPWGWYQTVDLGNRFRVKRILVEPGKRLSLQSHHHRAEHWIVVRGTAQVVRGDETLLLSENDSIYLPLGIVHRLGNPGKIPVEIIEIQTGAYLEEDDIVRLKDDFS